jgi:hypothetical protein
MDRDQTRQTARRATRSAIIAGMLVLLAVIGTVTRWVPDLISTVLGIAGVVLLIYAVATAILVLTEREPDE